MEGDGAPGVRPGQLYLGPLLNKVVTVDKPPVVRASQVDGSYRKAYDVAFNQVYCDDSDASSNETYYSDLSPRSGVGTPAAAGSARPGTRSDTANRDAPPATSIAVSSPQAQAKLVVAASLTEDVPLRERHAPEARALQVSTEPSGDTSVSPSSASPSAARARKLASRRKAGGKKRRPKEVSPRAALQKGASTGRLPVGDGFGAVVSEAAGLAGMGLPSRRASALSTLTERERKVVVDERIAAMFTGLREQGRVKQAKMQHEIDALHLGVQKTTQEMERQRKKHTTLITDYQEVVEVLKMNQVVQSQDLEAFQEQEKLKRLADRRRHEQELADSHVQHSIQMRDHLERIRVMQKQVEQLERERESAQGIRGAIMHTQQLQEDLEAKEKKLESVCAALQERNAKADEMTVHIDDLKEEIITWKAKTEAAHKSLETLRAKDEEPPNDEEIMQEMRMRQRELSRRDDAIARLEEEKAKMMELVQQANTRIDAVAEEEERLRVLADEATTMADKKTEEAALMWDAMQGQRERTVAMQERVDEIDSFLDAIEELLSEVMHDRYSSWTTEDERLSVGLRNVAGLIRMLRSVEGDLAEERVAIEEEREVMATDRRLLAEERKARAALEAQVEKLKNQKQRVVVRKAAVGEAALEIEEQIVTQMRKVSKRSKRRGRRRTNVFERMDALVQRWEDRWSRRKQEILDERQTYFERIVPVIQRATNAVFAEYNLHGRIPRSKAMASNRIEFQPPQNTASLRRLADDARSAGGMSAPDPFPSTLREMEHTALNALRSQPYETASAVSGETGLNQLGFRHGGATAPCSLAASPLAVMSMPASSQKSLALTSVVPRIHGPPSLQTTCSPSLSPMHSDTSLAPTGHGYASSRDRRVPEQPSVSEHLRIQQPVSKVNVRMPEALTTHLVCPVCSGTLPDDSHSTASSHSHVCRPRPSTPLVQANQLIVAAADTDAMPPPPPPVTSTVAPPSRALQLRNSPPEPAPLPSSCGKLAPTPAPTSLLPAPSPAPTPSHPPHDIDRAGLGSIVSRYPLARKGSARLTTVPRQSRGKPDDHYADQMLKQGTTWENPSVNRVQQARGHLRSQQPEFAMLSTRADASAQRPNTAAAAKRARPVSGLALKRGANSACRLRNSERPCLTAVALDSVLPLAVYHDVVRSDDSLVVLRGGSAVAAPPQPDEPVPSPEAVAWDMPRHDEGAPSLTSYVGLTTRPLSGRPMSGRRSVHSASQSQALP